jgi:hypothetical protein
MGCGPGVGFNIGISLLDRIEILTNNFNAGGTLDGAAGSATERTLVSWTAGPMRPMHAGPARGVESVVRKLA